MASEETMINNSSMLMRRLIPAAAMILGSACILETAMGPAATQQVVVIPGGGQTGFVEPGVASPTLESVLDLPPAWTATPQPTGTVTTEPGTPQPTSTATSGSVTMTAGQALSCVKGPHWVLYEWVTGIAKGETVTLLARSTADWPDYFYVRTSSGKECWAFGASSTKSGDPSTLPLRDAPPLPTITFIVQNNTYLSVEQLFIRAKNDSDWGADRLPGTVEHGATFSLTLTAGFYDILVKDQRGGIVFEKNDAAVGPNASTRTATIDGRYSQRFHSVSTVDICRVHVESADASYQANLTIPGDGRISPGEDVDLESLGGSFEVFFYRCGEDSAYWYAVSSVYFGPVPYTVTVH
jgi:hypothetical protein